MLKFYIILHLNKKFINSSRKESSDEYLYAILQEEWLSTHRLTVQE